MARAADRSDTSPGPVPGKRPYRMKRRAALIEEQWEDEARANEERRLSNPGTSTLPITDEELEALLLKAGAMKPWKGSLSPSDLLEYFNHWIDNSVSSDAFRASAARGAAMRTNVDVSWMTDWTPAAIASEKLRTWSVFATGFLEAYRLIVGSGNMSKGGPAVRFVQLALNRCGYGAHTEAAIEKQIQRQSGALSDRS